MSQKRKLGRGLSSLLTTESQRPVEVEIPQRETGTGLANEIKISYIKPNKYQPRTRFDPTALAELAASIRATGLVQPVVVRPTSGGYELVAGERRWRAATEAGLETIPAVIRELSDEESAQWALVENLQREDLNPVDRARAFENLSSQFGLSHAQIAERVGIDRTSVTNLIRMLELEAPVLEMIGIGKLSMGHGKALLAFPAGDGRIQLARAAARGGWSVRRVEAAARETKKSAPDKPRKPADIVELERQLSEFLGTKALIRTDRSAQKGAIVLEFYSIEHFDGLMSKFGFTARS